MIKKIFKTILIIILFIMAFFFIGNPPKPEKIIWGVNFSQKHAQNLGVDWRNSYSALIDELGVRNIKLAVHWDLIEPSKGEYDFSDLDWQIKKAEENGVNIIPTIGIKVPRWPECHAPKWAKDLTKADQQKEILEMLKEVVLRYNGSPSIKKWQVENEPFFSFGECQWTDKDFLKKEIDLVKSLDEQKRPIIISDSGEGSFWMEAAKLGDIVGTTMYRKVWMSQFNQYLEYHLPPIFYWRKAEIIKALFDKKVICIELQAEPWGPKLLYDSSLEEQEKTMDLGQFQKNIEFAKKTGFDEFYLWGSEWWYWMKEKQNKPEIWDEAGKLFKI
jgi:hypothetical protein